MMTINRLTQLLRNAAEYINQTVGSSESYDVLTNTVGFTESELDDLTNDRIDASEDECEEIFCDDITGVLGALFAHDMQAIPDKAVEHLCDAYAICSKALEDKSSENKNEI